MLAYGVDTITSYIQKVNVAAAIDLFKEIGDIAQVVRPYGHVDLMVGHNHAEVLPEEIAREGGLIL